MVQRQDSIEAIANIDLWALLDLIREMIRNPVLKRQRDIYDLDYKSYLDRSGYNGDIRDFQGKIEYAGRILLGTDDTMRRISEMLDGKESVMIGRFGGNELDAMISGLTENYPILNPYKWYRENQRYWGMYYGAGFFPKNANLIPRYAEKMYDSCAQLDLIGCWYNKYEDLIIEGACPDSTRICRLRALEPWHSHVAPWTGSLKGKKVLVVHPFADTMKRQYDKREKLFANPDYLPDMDISFLTAIQTGAGAKTKEYKNWFKAYDHMLNSVLSMNFEIAILGCGAYGFPLAADIKKAGKKALHLGGVTQLLFGIMGGRWDNDPLIKPLVTKDWVRPSDNEKPPKYKYIEGACYW